MSSLAGSAAEAAALRKEAKHTDFSHSYSFFPLAFETVGPINVEGLSFLSQLGHRISLVTEDSREISFLFQRISIVTLRFNDVCLNNTFSNVNGDPAGPQLEIASNIFTNFYGLGNKVAHQGQLKKK
jgi:hypothetical protein